MDKLCIFLVFALICSEALSLSLRQRRQATSDNPNNDIDDRFSIDNFNQFPRQFPGQIPCQGISCPFQSLPQRQQPLFPQLQQPQFPQQQQPQLPQPQFSQTQQPQFPQQQQQQQSSTTVAPTTSTTSAAFRDCRRNCPVTAEYNPVCGSDNQTYDNPGALSCAQACGASITLLRSSRCPAVQAN